MIGDWVKATNDKSKINFEEVAFSQNLVPNVIGMKAKDAVFLMQNTGLKTIISGRGKVKHQSIKAGKRASSYSSIKLQLATY